MINLIQFMKQRKLARKQNASQKSWFNVFILSFILILLALFIYKINSSVTVNTEAKGSCFCGELRCFNGNNLQKAYTEQSGQPQCCFGWPNGTLKSVEKNTCTIVRSVNPTVIPVDTGLGDGDISPTPTIAPTSAKNCLAVSCDSIGYNLISTKLIKKNIIDGIASYYPNTPNINCSGTPFRTNVDIISYCSSSCVTGTVGYGYCRGRSVWQKINENYDPTKDQVKTLGYYTNSDCTRSYVCNITPTSRPSLIPSPTPTPTAAVKGKTVILTNKNSFDLVIVWARILKYSNSTRTTVLPPKNFQDIFLKNTMFSAIGTFYSNTNRTVNLSGSNVCKNDQKYPTANYLITLEIRKTGFMNMVGGTRTIAIEVPCYKEGFALTVPLVLNQNQQVTYINLDESQKGM